jgi:hypothetical protein
MNGTNESFPPRFKDLRTIALAWYEWYDSGWRSQKSL